MRKLGSIWMRDPYLVSVNDVQDSFSGAKNGELALKTNKRYWLYGTTDKPPATLGNPYSEFPGTGFDAYCSDDLINWEGPFPAFRRPANFWADTQFWAPEVYLYNNRLIMFATMKKTGKSNQRGVVVLESPQNSPEGPFVPIHSNGPITPKSWSCLDGTLYVENSVPYVVFCREWTQVGDGQICAMELAPDLRTAKGQPFTLFTASQAPWSKSFSSSSSGTHSNFITDGPFLHRCETSGELIMLWSSTGLNDKYCVGIARSTSGGVRGPWVHDSSPLYRRDGGHAMISRVSYVRKHPQNNKKAKSEHHLLMLALHTPNRQVNRSSPKLLGIIEEREETTGLVKFDWFEFQ